MGVLFLLLLPTHAAAEIQFVEVSAHMGIDFVHENGVSPEKRLPETNGAGSAFFDWDTDGDQDLYLVNSGHMEKGRGQSWNGLYRNEGSVFKPVVGAAGARGESYGMGVVAADYDSDGDPDLYLTAWGPDQLYRSDGGNFTDATDISGLGHEGWTTSAVFLDMDLDGDLDLFAAQYIHFELGQQPWCGRDDMDLRFYCDPRVFESTADILYRNEGVGVFREVGLSAGIDQKGNGLGVVAGDWDLDGDPDLYVANDLSPNFHYVNQGNGRFVEDGLLTGTALSADGANQAGMGVDAGDIDADAYCSLVKVSLTIRSSGGQAHHRHDGISLKHHDPDVGYALEGVLGECRGGLNQVFNNGNIRGTGKGIQASQNIGKVTLQHGDGNAGAGGLDKVVAVSPGNHGNALATRAFCWLDGETGQILCHFPKMGDFVIFGMN